jgi:Protein of unknown function (DUF3098)
MSKKETKKQNLVTGFAIPIKNYRIIALGVATVVVGMLLMIGGGANDPNEFNAEELFSFRRIQLSPMTILLGFAIVCYGIMKKPKAEKDSENVG